MSRIAADKLAVASSQRSIEENYWIHQLSGGFRKSCFPYDFKKGSLSESKPDTVKFQINSRNFSSLMELSNNSDIRLYIILAAVLVLLLNKYTGDEDIILGAPVYRQDTGGDFINTVLVLRNRVEEHQTFKELLLQVGQILMEAVKHQNYPIERLLERLNIPLTEDGDCPLFDITILLDNIQNKKYIQNFHVNMSFLFRRTAEGIEGILEYNPNLHRRDSVQRIVFHFMHLLEKAIFNINSRISDLNILSEADRQCLLVEFNDTAAQYPQHRTLHELFSERVEQTPDRIAVIGAHKLHTGRRVREIEAITYRELNEKSNQLARQLRAAGVGPDTINGIMIEPGLAMIIAILAVLKAGGAYLPIDPHQPEERILYMLNDSGAVSLLTSRLFADEILFAGSILFIDDAGNYRGKTANLTQINRPGNLLYSIYTSGTTGKSKGVLLEHGNLVNYVWWFKQYVRLTAEDRAILTSSFGFDLGYTAIFPALVTGCQLHIIPREIYLSAAELINYISKNRITYIKVTPSLFSTIVESSYFLKENISGLRLVVLGGEAIKLHDVECAHTIAPHLQFMNHYGPTEATIGCVARFIDFNAFTGYLERPTIGYPISNMKVFIRDMRSNLLPVGIAGELCVGGAGVARGYLNRPELTAEKFDHHSWDCQRRQKIYKTGDRAQFLVDGNIEFLGRIDHQVKIRGFRIELGEIENQLLKHDEIKEAVVCLEEEHLSAYIAAHREFNASQLREYLLKKLPDYMIPSYFMQVEKIPLTANGKVDLKALEVIGKRLGSGTAYVAPQNEIEKKVVDTWKEVLQLDRVGIHDNYFELGGTSFDILKINSKLKETLDVEIPIVTMFRYTTVYSLSHYLKNEEGKIRDRAAVFERGKRDKTQRLQRRKEMRHG